MLYIQLDSDGRAVNSIPFVFTPTLSFTNVTNNRNQTVSDSNLDVDMLQSAGSFDSSYLWTTFGNATISNGKLNFTDAFSASDGAIVNPSIAYFQVGRKYRIKFTISDADPNNVVNGANGDCAILIYDANDTSAHDSTQVKTFKPVNGEVTHEFEAISQNDIRAISAPVSGVVSDYTFSIDDMVIDMYTAQARFITTLSLPKGVVATFSVSPNTQIGMTDTGVNLATTTTDNSITLTLTRDRTSIGRSFYNATVTATYQQDVDGQTVTMTTSKIKHYQWWWLK